MKTSYNELKFRFLHEIQVFPSIESLKMWPWYLWSIYKRALIQYGIQDGCQRRKIVSEVFFSYINMSLRFLWVKCVLIAMSVCFLYIIYNFEIFLTVDSSMASKMAAKMENSIYWWYFAVFYQKNHHIFTILRFRHHLECIMLVNCS